LFYIFKYVILAVSFYYKYLLTEEQKNAPLESLKSTKREIHPDWPGNYIDAVVDAMGKHPW